MPNRKPKARRDSVTTEEDASLVIDVLANDSDRDGDNLTIIAASDPTNGTVIVNEDGTITYIPDPDFNGTDQFTYTISDGNGGTSTSTVTVTVTGTNDAPVAGGDTVTANEDTPLVISAAGLLLNDSDVDGDALSIASFTQPANGTVVDNGDGTFTYEPAPGFTGTDSFTYTISDGNGGTDTATVTVTVDPVNDAPIVDLNGGVAGIDFAAAFTEGGGAVAIADAAATVSDVDSATLLSLTVTITNVQNAGSEVLVASPTGSVIVSGNGTDSLTLSGGTTLAEYEQVLRSITYENTSANPTQGIRTIEVVADDGSGGTSVTATSSIDVVGINDPPAVALPGGALGYTENAGAVVINAAATVSDPDSGDFSGGSLSVGFTANGTVNDQLAIENQGTGAGQIWGSGSDVTFV